MGRSKKMENLKHTPGPWSVGPLEGSQGFRVWQSDESENAKKIVGFVLLQTPSREADEETEANASLIAAAPDLLKALHEQDVLLGVLAGTVPLSEKDTHRRIGIGSENVRAAIARATGSQPC